jgi:hypothetical protein
VSVIHAPTHCFSVEIGTLLLVEGRALRESRAY